MISHADGVFVLDDGNDCGIVEHAPLVFRLEDFDKFVRDAAESAGENRALGVAAADEILRVGKPDIGGAFFRSRAPIRRAESVPPLLNFGGVSGSEIGERLRVEL